MTDTQTLNALLALGYLLRLDPIRNEVTVYRDHGPVPYPGKDIAEALRRALAATTTREGTR